ncbi:MAG: hypothetical protein GKR88_05545 [Flavobacteriaceae bacterium]|nr:MAG: hypothetical protein GKR88_05545 [Flavobacteriaceae bacterium]
MELTKPERTFSAWEKKVKRSKTQRIAYSGRTEEIRVFLVAIMQTVSILPDKHGSVN